MLRLNNAVLVWQLYLYPENIIGARTFTICKERNKHINKQQQQQQNSLRSAFSRTPFEQGLWTFASVSSLTVSAGCPYHDPMSCLSCVRAHGIITIYFSSLGFYRNSICTRINGLAPLVDPYLFDLSQTSIFYHGFAAVNMQVLFCR